MVQCLVVKVETTSKVKWIDVINGASIPHILFLRFRAHNGRMEDFKSQSTGRTWVKLFWIWRTTALLSPWWLYLSAQDQLKNRQVNIAAWRWGSRTATLNWGVIDSWRMLERDRQLSWRVWSPIDQLHSSGVSHKCGWGQHTLDSVLLF